MKRFSENTVGVLMALLAIFLFSSKAILVKVIYQFEIPTVHILLLRMLFALPFYVFILYFNKQKSDKSLQKKHYAMLLPFGVMGYYVASFFDFYGLKYLSASLERIILFVYPTLVVIISAVFLNTKISKQLILAIAITYLGVILTFSSELTLDHHDKIYLGAGLIFISALPYAIYLVGSSWLIPKFGTVKFTSLAMIVACAAVISHYTLTDRTNIIHHPKEVYIYCLVMAIFCTVLPSYLVSFAIKKLGASRFSIIGSIGPVFTISLAMIFLGESITIIQMIGVAIVIIGVKIVTKK